MSGNLIKIWPEISSKRQSEATLTLYPISAPADTGTVLILPGGGYQHLAEHEGKEIALWLNGAGFHAAVLKYSLAPNHKHPTMIQDALRAMRLLRKNSSAWNIAGGAIAVMGFSAGGHLASTLAVHYDKFTCEQDDLAQDISARPDAEVLCYPVINMTNSFAHSGSRKNLLGDNPDSELAHLMSTDQHITKNTPPTFLWHTADDPGVSVENSLSFAQKCHENNVPVELHVFEHGVHGLGLAKGNPDVHTWTKHCALFLQRHLGVCNTPPD